MLVCNRVANAGGYSATSGNAGGRQHVRVRGGRGLRCVFLCILSHTCTRVSYFGASKFLRARTACVALWATFTHGNGSVVSSAGSLQVAGVFRPCTGIVSRRAPSGIRVPTRGKRRLRRGGLSMWRHRAHNYLRAFKVVARLEQAGCGDCPPLC